MASSNVTIPDAFVEFMQDVVEHLDSSAEDDRALADNDDGLQCDQGYGGRQGDHFTFVFCPADRDER
jgi:hypothetical protein